MPNGPDAMIVPSVGALAATGKAAISRSNNLTELFATTVTQTDARCRKRFSRANDLRPERFEAELENCFSLYIPVLQT